MSCSGMIRYPHFISWKRRCKSFTTCRESNTLFWFFFFSTSLALRSEKSVQLAATVTVLLVNLYVNDGSSKALLGSNQKRELFCKPTWPYKGLQLLQKAFYGFDHPFSLAIRLGESGAASGMKKAIFLCKLLVLY